MLKQLFILSLCTFLAVRSNSISVVVPFNPTSVPGGGADDKAMLLSEKLNINSEAFKLAIKGYEKLKEQGRINNLRFLTIIDYSKPSNEQRLYVVDMVAEELIIKSLVAHGKNSGRVYANNFSNRNSSFQSSLGFYITGNTFFGKHGTTLELEGIEEGINDQAKHRSIVLHSAYYVSDAVVQQQGFIGRSLGCPAVPADKVYEIIENIQGASCMFVYAPNKDYLNKSQLIK